MDIEFYKLKGYETTIWFTDATMAEFKAWAKENNIAYFSCWTQEDRIGFVPSDKDRVMFELFYGYDVRAPKKKDYYDDWADEYWTDYYDDE